MLPYGVLTIFVYKKSDPVLVQEFEVQFNTIGAGLRKFANEANDFVQEMLAVPIGTDGTCEKVVDLPKQRDGKVVQGEKQVAKQPMKQQAAAPMNFFDEACMKMSTKGELSVSKELEKVLHVSDLWISCVLLGGILQ